MPAGSLRILMSMRAVGEGHISSIAFREGIITDDRKLKLAPEPPFATATDVIDNDDEIPQGPVTVYRHRDSTLSGTVIFPITHAQSKGLEDLRLVRFEHDDGGYEWLGRSEEHTSELQSLMRSSYAVFCLTKKHNRNEK